MKSFIALLLAFIMLSSFATAAVNKMKKTAHKGQDRWSHPQLWVGLTTQPKTQQQLNGGRCLGDAYCDAPNRCSRWGWCQGTSYKGPFFP